jgi:hypothetical protein
MNLVLQTYEARQQSLSLQVIGQLVHICILHALEVIREENFQHSRTKKALANRKRKNCKLGSQ